MAIMSITKKGHLADSLGVMNAILTGLTETPPATQRQIFKTLNFARRYGTPVHF